MEDDKYKISLANVEGTAKEQGLIEGYIKGVDACINIIKKRWTLWNAGGVIKAVIEELEKLKEVTKDN